MVDQRVGSFIQNALKNGNSKSQIEQALLKKGWKIEQVNEAFAEVSSTPKDYSNQTNIHTKLKKSLFRNPIFLTLILLVVIFLFAFLAYFLLSGEECSIDSDCDSGFSCDGGSCIEDTGCSSDDDCGRGEVCESSECVEEEVVIEEEEPECSTDDECGGFACTNSGSCYDTCVTDSECADEFLCSSGVCEEDISSSEVTISYEDYEVLDIVLDDPITDRTEGYDSFLFYVNYTNVGDSSSPEKIALACLLYFENGTYLNSSYSYVNFLEAGDSGFGACSVFAGNLISELEISARVNVTVNATINYYNNVTESNYQNSLLKMFVVSLFNTSILSSTTCTDASSCSGGYDCAVVDYCFDTCTDSGSECVKGYSCESGNCVVDTVVLLEKGDVCNSNSDCSSDYCSSTYHVCTECESNTDCEGYVCDTSDLSNGGSCSNSCTSNSGCDSSSGFSCDIVSTSATYQKCIECSSDSNCDSTEYCSSEKICESRLGLDCSLDNTVCNTYICDGVCVECTSSDSSNCGEFDCDISSGICYTSCTGNSECNSGYSCINSNCIPEGAISSACGEVIPTCADGIDNDKDGYIDLKDVDSCSTWIDDEIGYSCVDTDSSESYPYLVEGKLTLTDQSGVETVVSDYCDGNNLYEYSCQGSNPSKIEYDCTSLGDYICENGACKEDNSCLDLFTYDASIGECVVDTSYECSDGLDNNGNRYYDGVDYYGACDRDSDGEPDLSCQEALGLEFIQAITDVGLNDYLPIYCYSICELGETTSFDDQGDLDETYGIYSGLEGYGGRFYEPDSACSSWDDDSESCESDDECKEGYTCGSSGVCIKSTCLDGEDNDIDGTMDFEGAMALTFTTDSSYYISCSEESSVLLGFITLWVPDGGVLSAALQGKGCETQCNLINELNGDTVNNYTYTTQCAYIEGDTDCSSENDIEGGNCADAQDNDGDGYIDWYGACSLDDEGVITCIDVIWEFYSDLTRFKGNEIAAAELIANDITDFSGECEDICRDYFNGEYLNSDSDCSSFESSEVQVPNKAAPLLEEVNLVQRWINFVIKSQVPDMVYSFLFIK